MVENSNQTNQPSAELLKMIAQAKSVGHNTVPAGTSELEEKILAIFKGSGKILTAKQVCGIIKEKDTKFYSDKLWYMAKAGKLEKLKTRGYYRIAASVSPSSED